MSERGRGEPAPLIAVLPAEGPGEMGGPRPRSPTKGFFVRHSRGIEVLARVGFAGAVIAAGINHIAPGGAESYAAQVPSGGPWFSFWSGLATSNPHAFSDSISILDFVLGASILLGLLRKVIYLLGIGLGVFLWIVPEGFSGLESTRGLSASAGLLYVVGVLLLITIETTYGPDPWTLDHRLSARSRRWARLSNFVGRSDPLPPPSYMIAMTPLYAEEATDPVPERRPGDAPRPRR